MLLETILALSLQVVDTTKVTDENITNDNVTTVISKRKGVRISAESTVIDGKRSGVRISAKSTVVDGKRKGVRI